jgi:hypothetical protein
LDGVAPGGDRQPGQKTRETTQVSSAVSAIAERDVFHCFGFNTRLLDGVADGVRRHGHRRGHVETTAAGLCHTGPGVGNENCFAHDLSSPGLNGVRAA